MAAEAIRVLVTDRAQARCEYCRAPQAASGSPFEIEHIIPVSRGGSDEMTNLALSCASCNSHKASSTRGIDPNTGLEAGLFNPRQDNWNHHFAFVTETFELRGLSPKGRATIARLQMNKILQTEARRFWVQLNGYP